LDDPFSISIELSIGCLLFELSHLKLYYFKHVDVLKE
jgi:hypothetical protein